MNRVFWILRRIVLAFMIVLTLLWCAIGGITLWAQHEAQATCEATLAALTGYLPKLENGPGQVD